MEITFGGSLSNNSRFCYFFFECFNLLLYFLMKMFFLYMIILLCKCNYSEIEFSINIYQGNRFFLIPKQHSTDIHAPVKL